MDFCSRLVIMHVRPHNNFDMGAKNTYLMIIVLLPEQQKENYYQLMETFPDKERVKCIREKQKYTFVGPRYFCSGHVICVFSTFFRVGMGMLYIATNPLLSRYYKKEILKKKRTKKKR